MPSCPDKVCTSGEVCGQGAVGKCSIHSDDQMQHWKDSKSDRDQKVWNEVVTEYNKIYESLDQLHDRLKKVKNSKNIQKLNLVINLDFNF